MDKPQKSANGQAKQGWKKMKDLLDKEMPVEKKNRRRFILLFLFLLTGSMGMLYWYGYNGNNINQLSIEKDKTQEHAGNEQKQLHGHSMNASKAHTSKAQMAEQPGTLSSRHANDLNVGDVPEVQTEKQLPVANAHPRPLKRSLTSLEKALAINSTIGKTKNAGNNTSSRRGVINKNNNAESYNATIDLDRANIVMQPAEQKTTNQLSGVSGSAIADTKHVDTSHKATPERQPSVAQSSAQKKIPVVKNKKRSRLQYGLEWTLPLPINNNALFVEANAKKYPLTICIPAVWFSGSISNRSSLYFSANPFAQYLLSRHSAIQKGGYSFSAVSASNINQPRDIVSLTQVFSVYKVRGVEVGLQYAYQLSQKLSVSGGVSSTLTTSAVFNERVIKNATDVVKDSLYGVVKADKAWDHIKAAFAMGRVSMFYNFKRFEAGATLSKPLSSVYKSDFAEKLPLNVQVFLRWKLKWQ